MRSSTVVAGIRELAVAARLSFQKSTIITRQSSIRLNLYRAPNSPRRNVRRGSQRFQIRRIRRLSEFYDGLLGCPGQWSQATLVLRAVAPHNGADGRARELAQSGNEKLSETDPLSRNDVR
jgi:hypothetical protein